MRRRGLAFVVLLTGCASPAFTGIPDSWPGDWPPLTSIKAPECARIEGTYADAGQSVYSQAYPWQRSLSNRLIHFSPRAAGARVRIAQSPDELQVEVTDGSLVLKRGTLSRVAGDFECDEEGIWIKAATKTASDEFGYTRSSISMGLRPAGGGVLAGQERNRTFGMVLWVVPVLPTQRIWYRWDSQAQ
jgi:hypothetical protein